MTYYAVIDTNVLVSGLLSQNDDSATVQILSLVVKGFITPVYNSSIIKEYRNVLSRNKFGFTLETIDYLLSAIEKYGIIVMLSSSGIMLPDKNDLPFYDAAFQKQSNTTTYLITGNIKHFPKEEFIVTPREFIDIISSRFS